MEELYACRVCLITDVKLFDMSKNNIADSFEMFSGSRMSAGLPGHICSMCAALLHKSVAFRNKCDRAQNILACALKQQRLTTAYLRSIDRHLHSLNHPLTIETAKENYFINETQVTYKIKEEYLDDTIDTSEISLKCESDDEPLAKIMKKKPRKPSKNEKYNVETRKSTKVDSLEDFNDINIVILSKKQQIEEVLSRKDSSNYLNSFFKCDKCFKGFLTSSTLKNHMVKHDLARGAHECDVCRTRWPTRAARRTHAVTSHERRYACRTCDHVSKSSHAAKEHSKWHTGFKYTCKMCGATFSKSSSHLTHIRIHHPSSHVCECGAAFIGQHGLALHRKRAHKQEATSKSRCDVCRAQFVSEEALRRHDTGRCDTLRPCLICGEGFSTDEKLTEHSKIHQKSKVKCQECNRTFAHQKSYALHYHRTHLRPAAPRGGAPDGGVCEACGKRCVSKAALRYHQRSHTGEKPYPCTVCPKRFAMPMFLQNHMRTHTGERPFACPRCGKTFSSRAALVRHNRVHTGAKPYKCLECDKRFTQSNSMKLHVRCVHRQLSQKTAN